MDKEIQRAIEEGERNKATIELVRNWCRHARITRSGGVGMIEANTGLPIGHFGMGCQFASPAGIMSHDLRNAVVPFYDANCARCAHRVPAGIPNISQLVDERDQAVARRAQVQADAEASATKDRERREEKRTTLRSTLGTIPQTIVDQLDEIDRNRTSDAATAFVKTASLAPETFVPAIIDYLYEMIHANEDWIARSALRVLDIVDQSSDRLMLAAVATLERGLDDEAAAILARSARKIQDDDVAKIFYAAAEFARPRRYALSHSAAIADPSLLHKLFRDQPETTTAEIRRRLNLRAERDVHLAARAIDELVSVSPTLPLAFLRDIVALLCRVDRLVDDYDDQRHHDRLLDRLEVCCDHCLRTSPGETVKLIRDFAQSASVDGVVRLVEAYDHSLSQRPPERIVPAAGHIEAILSHLMELGSTSRDYQVLDAVAAIFRDGRAFSDGIAEYFDVLLGWAAVLLHRLPDLVRPEMVPDTLFNNLEFENARNAVTRTVEGTLRVLVRQAMNSPTRVVHFVEFMNALPDGNEVLKGEMVEAMAPLMDRADYLSIVLPTFYSSLLGSSALLRAHAVRALRALSPRATDNLPELVFEAAMMLLYDRFVIVHQNAFSAVDRGSFPFHYKQQLLEAVANLINSYAGRNEGSIGNRDDFLLDCIKYFCRHADPGYLSVAAFSDMLIDELMSATANRVSRDIRSIQHGINNHPRFVELLIHLASDEDAARHDYDDLRKAFTRLPASSLQSAANRIYVIAQKVPGGRNGSSLLLECLTRVGALDQARAIAEMAFDAIPDTVRDAALKEDARLRVLSIEMELLIEAGDTAGLHRLRNTFASIKTAVDERASRDQNEPPFPSHFFSP